MLAKLFQRRSKLIIINDILGVAEHGANKTRIVYRANLNFRILKDYLTFLKRTELVTVEQNIVRTTEKGNRYRQAFRDLIRTMSLLEH